MGWHNKCEMGKLRFVAAVTMLEFVVFLTHVVACVFQNFYMAT